MQTAIKVEQLSKSYGNLLAIDQISLSVKYGTVYGLLGANGAGKSTTIECILGTKKADSGTVSDLRFEPERRQTPLVPKCRRTVSGKQLSAGNQGFRVMR